MSRTISVGQLRQNPTEMLREVRAGAAYTITDHGDPVAQVTSAHRPRWIPIEQLNELLAEVGADQSWAEEIAEDRAATQISDPWETI